MRAFAMISLLFLSVTTGFSVPLNGTSSTFDIKNANKQFDRVNLQLSVQNLNIDNLNSAVNLLTRLIHKADQCVEDVQKKLNNTEMLIKQATGAEDKKSEGADLVYLNTQQKELADEQAQCRLFSIRAREAIEAYKDAIAQLKQKKAFARGAPLWNIIHQTIEADPEEKLKSLLTLTIPALLPPWLSWVSALIIAGLVSIYVLKKLQKSRFSRRYLRFKEVTISSMSLLTSFLLSGALFIYFLSLSQDISTSDLPLVLSGILFFYFSSCTLISFLFKMKKIRAFFYWYSLDNVFFQHFSLTLLTFYTAALIGQLLSTTVNPNSPLWQLTQSSFILFVLVTEAYFINRFCEIHRELPSIKNHYRLIQRIAMLILSFCGIINVLGYYPLSQNLTLSGFTSFIIVFITLLITQGINKLYLTVMQQKSTKTNIIKYFGYRKDQTFTEFLILKTVTQFIVFAISLYLLGQSWGFATDFIGTVYEQLLHGVQLFNITLYPMRIISGVVVFCLLYLLFRAISTAISSHQQFEDEEETQVAVASILTYIGFSIALITGFLVAGFDFTGLAIIAGALSVGIGLGLQSIVNNFVSGLILLIEKPIRPGDRINVDGVEGFVKKIRVRSTQIITPGREDIIVPNSDLITRRVTNYMFSDKYCRITCELGIAYGNDTQLVRDILLNIANAHDEVIKNSQNKPVVLFHAFTDDKLIFKLVCLIKDVNKKSLVHSELNYAIEQAFREHNIDMPFQQRDIELKLSNLAFLISKMGEINKTS